MRSPSATKKDEPEPKKVSGAKKKVTPKEAVARAAVGGFEQRMARLVATLHEQLEEGAKLVKAIRKNLRGLGYGS